MTLLLIITVSISSQSLLRRVLFRLLMSGNLIFTVDCTRCVLSDFLYIVKALYIWVDVMSEVGNHVMGYLLMFNKWPPLLFGHL